MARRKRRKLTPELEADAVRLCGAGGRSIAQVTRLLPSSRRLALVASASAIAASLALSYAPDADGCGGGGFYSSSNIESLPAEGYPANAYVLLFGHGVHAAGLTATVDGQPATLVASAGPSTGLGQAYFTAAEGIAVRVTPEPPLGSQVAIQGDACAPYGCPVDIAFAAAAPDTDVPVAPSALSFDVYDFVEHSPSDEAECGGYAGEGIVWFVRAQMPDTGDLGVANVFEWHARPLRTNSSNFRRLRRERTANSHT